MTNQITAKYYHHMGDDITTVNAARVSFAKQSKLVCTDLIQGTYDLDKRDKKLIAYLAKHKHLSPFNHASVTFVCKAPIFVARQLQKHEYMPWNEVSRRYVSDNIELYQPDVWRGKSADKKQGSSGVCQPPQWLDSTMNQVLDLYDQMIHDGVAPEQARMVLPQSMMTEWYWSGSLDAFADMCRLRITPDTQHESKQVALGVDKEMLKLFPVSWIALEGVGND